MSEHANLITALIAAQSEIGTITKDKTAKAGAYGYTYADLPAVLEAVQPALHGNGLCITQTVQPAGGNDAPHLVTNLYHTSGEKLTGFYPLIIPSMDDPQKLGGAVTYARRYSILAMLNLATEDDDGQHARTPSTPTRTEMPRNVQQTAQAALPTAARPASPSTSATSGWSQFWASARANGLSNRADFEEQVGPLPGTPDEAHAALAGWMAGDAAPSTHAPTPRPAAGKREDKPITGTISEKQVKYLYVLTKGMDEAEVADALEEFGVTSFEELDRQDASKLVDAVKQITGQA